MKFSIPHANIFSISILLEVQIGCQGPTSGKDEKKQLLKSVFLIPVLQFLWKANHPLQFSIQWIPSQSIMMAIYEMTVSTLEPL